MLRLFQKIRPDAGVEAIKEYNKESSMIYFGDKLIIRLMEYSSKGGYSLIKCSMK